MNTIISPTSTASSTTPPIEKDSLLQTSRIEELDYLKCLFVLLMVAFHLAYFADGYPLLKQWVYTFHMPGFLLISGYLMRVDRALRKFARTLLWLAVPYLVLESSYIILSSFLPVRDGIDHLTVSTFADKFSCTLSVLTWYLHTLILCGIGYFVIWQQKGCNTISRLILLGFYLAGLSFVQLVAWDVSLYFLLGIIIRQSKLTFLQVFRPSWLAFIALLWLSCYPETFHKDLWGGVATVYLVISAALAVFPHLLTMHQKSRTLFRAQFACPISLLSYFHNGVQDIHPVSYIRFLTRAVSHLIFAALHTRRSCSLQSIRCAAPLTLVVWTKKGSDINLFYLNFFHTNIEKKLLFHRP